MSNLKELREQWEYKADLTYSIPDCKDCFLVVVGRREDIEKDGACGKEHEGKCFNILYSLYRYFKIGDKWEVSADVQNKGPQCIFRAIDNHNFMQGIPNK